MSFQGRVFEGQKEERLSKQSHDLLGDLTEFRDI